MSTGRIFHFAISLMLCAKPLWAAADGASTGPEDALHEHASVFTWVPAQRLFPITFADPREIRTAVSFSQNIDAIVGSYLTLFEKRAANRSWAYHFGLEGRGLFTMRQEGGRFPLETVDGTIGFYLETARGPWHWQLRFTHVSAHLADGSSGTAFPYSRETVSLRAGYSPSENFHVYVGLHRLVHTMPEVFGAAAQIGASYFVPVGGRVSPFIAGDLRWQEESKNVNPALALQMGLAVHEPGSPRRSFRLFYSYYTGADVRGQFYYLTRTIHSFGLEFPL